MTEPVEDFETYLKTRTVLPNGMSDDDKLEPPKALDMIVLNRAREAIRAQQRPSRQRRWAAPVALAATILLCLSILLNVSLNTNRRMTVAGGASSEVILPEAKIVEPRAPRPPVIAETQTPAAATTGVAANSTAGRADQLTAGTRTPRQRLIEAAPAAKSKEAKAGDRPVGTGSADESRTSMSARSEAASPAKPPLGDSDTLTARSYPGAAAVQAPASATSEPTTRLPPEAGAEVERTQPPSARAKAKPAGAPPHRQDPETWLRQIAALRAEGKTAQADAEIQRFKATFPTYKQSPTQPAEPPK